MDKAHVLGDVGVLAPAGALTGFSFMSFLFRVGFSSCVNVVMGSLVPLVFLIQAASNPAQAHS